MLLKHILKKIYWFIALFVLFYLLYFRFAESITRGYGVDEYYHLHYAWLLTQGKLPYTDFQTLYSPFFHLTLLPVFKSLGDTYLVFTVSRIVIFAFFLLGLVFTFGIGLIISSFDFALLAVIIAAGLPMGIEKAIEIRPDNLMTMLFLGGLFFLLKGLKSGKRWPYIFSGILFGIGFLVLIKISFAFMGLGLGFLILLVGGGVKKKQLKGLVVAIISFAAVIVLSGLVLIVRGLLPAFLQQVILSSNSSLSALRFGLELHPFYWFFPNDGVYGIYKGFAWYLNCLLFLTIPFFLIGLFRDRKKENCFYRVLLFFPLISSFLYLYLVLRPFQQYLLLFLSLVPFFIAWGISDSLNLILQKHQWPKYLMMLIIFAGLVAAMHESWQVKKRWFDEYDRRLIDYILTKTQKEDVFWGGDANYVFRFDGYYSFSLRFLEMPAKIIAKYPPLIPMLEERKTKYLLLPSNAVYKRTWPFDTRDKDEFVNWVKKNFAETDYSGIWKRKEIK